MVPGSAKAEVEEHRESSTHAVSLEDAYEDSEDTHDSDGNSSNQSAPALV